MEVQDSFAELLNQQIEVQQSMIKKGLYDDNIDYVTKNTVELPFDHPKVASYHVQQLMSEIGEVLDADKRWKNMRNGKYDREAKLEEIADCFIVMMNIALFSGFTPKELEAAIVDKQVEVQRRVNNELKGGN